MNSALRRSILWVLALVALGPGCMYISGQGLLDLGPKPLRETLVFGEGGDKILAMDISGVITEEEQGGLLSLSEEPSTISSVKEQLEKAGKDDRIKGLLLIINSPGGTVTGSDIVYREIKDYKAKKGVKVAAYMLGTAASGAYYISQAADRLIASPTAVTGSIGVILLNLNLSGLMEKIGVSDTSVKTGALKDAGSPFRKPCKEDQQYLQGIADGMFARFCQVIEENRPGLRLSEKPQLTDGRIFTAQQALDNGLVDQIGYLNDAVDWIKKTSGTAEARVVRYSRGGKYVPSIYAAAQAPGKAGGDINLFKFDVQGLPFGSGPAFMYLWKPDL
jgi:protease IV